MEIKFDGRRNTQRDLPKEEWIRVRNNKRMNCLKLICNLTEKWQQRSWSLKGNRVSNWENGNVGESSNWWCSPNQQNLIQIP